MTWLRALSSGGIVDAASVSVNAIGRRHGRGRQRLRSNSLARREMSGRTRKKSSAAFRFALRRIAGSQVSDAIPLVIDRTILRLVRGNGRQLDDS
jgi:hypothetical protein